jgi:hypothetical protein
MVRTFLNVYMELGSYFLFLQKQIKDIIAGGGESPYSMYVLLVFPSSADQDPQSTSPPILALFEIPNPSCFCAFLC